MPRRTILSPAERRQRNRDEVINGILEAARIVMREEGVAALNLQEVARRVGMRAPSLYTYFPGKMAIYDALFQRGMRQYTDGVAQTIERYGATWAGIEAAIEHYMAFGCENPELYQLMFERPVPGFVPSAASMKEVDRLLVVSGVAMQSVIDAGVIAPGMSTEQANNLFVAIMHGVTALHLANEPHLPPGEGRFGSLIPVVISLLKAVWSKQEENDHANRDTPESD